VLRRRTRCAFPNFNKGFVGRSVGPESQFELAMGVPEPLTIGGCGRGIGRGELEIAGSPITLLNVPRLRVMRSNYCEGILS